MFQAQAGKSTLRRGVIVPANTPFPVAPNEIESLERAGYTVTEIPDPPKSEGELIHLEGEKGEIKGDIPEEIGEPRVLQATEDVSPKMPAGTAKVTMGAKPQAKAATAKEV